MGLNAEGGRLNLRDKEVTSTLDIRVDQNYTGTKITVRLTPDIEVRLERMAKKIGRTKTNYVREVILEHLEDLGDVYLATQRLLPPVASTHPGK